MRLKDKVAIITGAGDGIGRATALLFAEEGARIVVNDIVPEAASHSVQIIRGQGGDAVVAIGDVSGETTADLLAETALKTYGRVDILFNNAGVLRPHNVLEETLEGWNWVISTNVTAIFLASRRVIPEMIKAGGGVIVNTASAGGRCAHARSRKGQGARTNLNNSATAPRSCR